MVVSNLVLHSNLDNNSSLYLSSILIQNTSLSLLLNAFCL